MADSPTHAPAEATSCPTAPASVPGGSVAPVAKQDGLGPEDWHATSPLATQLLAGDVRHRACWLGAGNEVFCEIN